MYIDKIIKREVLVLIISLIVSLIVIIGISYALFYKNDETDEETIAVSSINITFCSDSSCNDKYENMGNIIGTFKENNMINEAKIYPYEKDIDAFNTLPFIFNIKNNGDLTSYITIKLKEERKLLEENNLTALTDEYISNIKVGISDCNSEIERNNVDTYRYESLSDGVIKSNIILSNNESKTYCLWVWLDNETPNEVQDTYFIASIDLDAEYKPN